MRILLLKGSSQYGALRLHLDQLADGFRAVGQEATTIDLVDPAEAAGLTPAFAATFDALFSFNGVFAAENAALIDQLGLVAATMFLDHPAHHRARLEAPWPRGALLFLDRSHVAFLQAMGAAERLGVVGFCPPGANLSPAPPQGPRDIEILFSGTYRGEPARPWLDMPRPLGPILAATADRMAADSTLALLDALGAALPPFGMSPSGAFLDLIAPFLTGVQAFAEAYHRDAFLHALGRARTPLTVVGGGWPALCATYPSFTHLGEGSFAETLDLLHRTKVAVNVNNGFVAGGHERVFAAMAAGAAVFCERSRYYDETFSDGRHYRVFDSPSGDDVAERLCDFAADGPRRAEIAAQGRSAALAGHLWRHRAETIVAAILAARRAPDPAARAAP